MIKEGRRMREDSDERRQSRTADKTERRRVFDIVELV